MFKIKGNLDLPKENTYEKLRTSPDFKNKNLQNTPSRQELKNSTVITNAASGIIFGDKIEFNKQPMPLQNKKEIFSNTYNSPDVNISTDFNYFPHFSNYNQVSPEAKNNQYQFQYPKGDTNLNNTHTTHLTHLNLKGGYPSLITPQIKNIVGLENEYYKNKNAINLEDLSLQEDRVWKVLESLRYNFNVNFSSDEYLEFLNLSSIQSLDIYFKTPELKKEILKSANLEICSVMCVMISFLKQKLNEVTISHLKNLMYNVHQNIILLISLILKRLPRDFDRNDWVSKLNTTVFSKKAKYQDNDDEFLVEQNNRMIYNMLIKFIHQNFKGRGDLLPYDKFILVTDNIDKLTFVTVKNILFDLKNMLLVQMSTMNQTMMNFPNLPAPYLPPLDKNTYTYTLVMDLDETLVHYSNQPDAGEPLIRPGAEKFLEELSNHYEIVVFTAAVQDYADWILDILDKDRKFIKHRLYRHHASINKNTYVKDISKLGRDLSKTIIVDNVWENFQMQPENGIFIKTWIDDMNDTSLFDLIYLLKQIEAKKVKDVRKTLRKVRDELIRLYVKGDTNPFETLLKKLDLTGDNK